MSISVAITDRLTGETRAYTPEWLADWEEGRSDFIWAEGNYACDCNRALFFKWAANDAEAALADETPCGDTRYFVRITQDGVVVYEDDDGPEQG